MAPPSVGKRKRVERSWSGDSNDGQRPSPYRPGHMAPQSHPQSPSRSRDSGDTRGRSGQRPSRSGRSQPGRAQTQDSNQPSVDTDKASPVATPQTSAASEERQTNGDTTATGSAQPASVSGSVSAAPPTEITEDGGKVFYEYEYVTKDVAAEWSTTGKNKIVGLGTEAREGNDTLLLSKLFQEVIRSVLDGRLPPAEAGDAVKQILGDEVQESTEDDPESFKAFDGKLETCSLFLDTLSILADETDATTDPAIKNLLAPFVFATQVPPALLRFGLDTNLVQGLGLVRDTFTRMGIRKQTNILYRQSNYNLLREESEGYSKLVTELFTTSNSESPSSEIVEETFERVKAMIGAFDLDVGRVLDVTLDVFAAVLVKKYHFFVRFLRASSWWPKADPSRCDENDPYSGLPMWALPGWTGIDDEKKEELAHLREERDRKFWDRVREIGLRAWFEMGRRPVEHGNNDFLSEADEDTKKWVEQTGTLPPKGNRVAAQLLGFKLRFYSSHAKEAGVLPENLIWVAALLIKIGFISLRDLYPHLWRPDDLMDELKSKLTEEKKERERKALPGGGVNALMLAGALPDDTVPASVSRSRESEARSTSAKDSEAEKAAKNEEPSPEIREQKVDLLKSLLTIGAIPDALYIISRFPWLMQLCPELPDYVHRILHHCLSKLYNDVRPLKDADRLRAARRVPSLDQTGVPKGQVRLVDPQPRKLLRWAHPDREDHEEGINYRFYWDHWADNIPVCQTVDDFFALASTFLNVTGVKIGQDPFLLSKIARIGKHSVTTDHSESNKARWRDLCKRLLLPALSLTRLNPGVVNEVYDLVRMYPRVVRYDMYTEWYSGPTSQLPELKSAFALATAETKDALKRMAATEIKPSARRLAKVAYSNPGIVINVAVSQIESYDNFIDVIVECVRYFTDLAYDILTWSLINSLRKTGRSRVQQGGLLTSRWLNALASFTGKAFKRYSVMNPTPILQYVFEQLRRGNSTDLIVLEQMVSSMAGIITDTNFNDSQIQAMAGGSLLQSRVMLQLLDKRHESKMTSRRLMKSLTDSKLAGQLLVALAQERVTCVFRDTQMNAELKLLGNKFDEIHRILTQYLDLLRSNLTVSEFDALVPRLASLIGEFGVQPEVGFWICRDSIHEQIEEANRAAKEESSASKATENVAKSEQAPDGDVEMSDDQGKPEEGGETTTNEETEGDKSAQDTTVTTNGPVEATPTPSAGNTPWHPVLHRLMDELKPVLDPQCYSVVGLPFYTSFWQLSLYDIHIPLQAYQDEMERLRRNVVTISSDRSDVSLAGSQRKEREKKHLQELQDRLLAENKRHLQAYEQTRARLQKEKDKWFAGMRGKFDMLNIALLEQCFLPRLLMSPIDAYYCFKMLKFLHSSGAANFRTVGLLDQLFRDQRLTAIIFQCTSKEADNFGRFLKEVLHDLTRWHADKAVYEKEAYGTKRDLPGFAMNVDADGKPTTFLDYEDFRRLLYKWHRLICASLKSCLNGGEYMHIRNAISVLKAIVQYFPAVNWMGRDMLTCVNTLSKEDKRDDVKIPAASLIGDLNRREKKWMLPQAFMIVGLTWAK